jgi:hypothetical protein
MWFKITYIDPDTQEDVTEEKEFFSSENPAISAQEWAEDYAYGRADKEPHSVREMRKEKV